MKRSSGGRIVIAGALAAAVGIAGLAWWWTRPVPPSPPSPLAGLTGVDFAAVPGWSADAHAEALTAFQRSCARLVRLAAERRLGRGGLAGTAADWHGPCAEAAKLQGVDNDTARRFFEVQFRPVAVTLAAGAGKFTGYYEPLLRGSRTPDETFAVPLHKRPDDLLTADLGAFKKKLRGQSVVGRIDGNRFVPYFSRGEILDGALDGRDLELVWVDSAVDAFFLHIQGSGQVALPDGSRMRVGYAGKNGHRFVAIGRELLRRKLVPPDKMSMQAIRGWLADNPAEADKLMRLNRSYIFFYENPGDGPIGAQGVVLSPGRSLAVDRDIYPMGVPIWVDTAWPGEKDRPLRRLMVAQDTGGAINGAVRGDVYFGAGDEAGELAGRMNQPGTWYLLLPRSVKVSSLLY